MNTVLTIENDDIFCGDTFVMTINRVGFIEISLKDSRLFINNTFVKEFSDPAEALDKLKPLIQSLELEDIDFDFSNS
jgi:hypothetical protein